MLIGQICHQNFIAKIVFVLKGCVVKTYYIMKTLFSNQIVAVLLSVRVIASAKSVICQGKSESSKYINIPWLRQFLDAFVNFEGCTSCNVIFLIA